MEETLDPTVFTADAVLNLAEQPLGAIEGIAHRVLWTDGTSMAGRMTIAGGHHLGAHQHRLHSHHLWITAGRVEILGALLGAGSYVHIPPGVNHDLDARGTEGCTVFYVYEA